MSINKKAGWMDVHAGLQAHLESCLTDHQKGAELSTAQGTQEHKGVALGKSDSEVTGYLPNGGNAGNSPTDLVTERGAENGQALPDQPNPKKTEELERKEVSPATKLAEDAHKIASSLVADLTDVATLINSKAAGTPVPETPESPAAAHENMGSGENKPTGGTPETKSLGANNGPITQTEEHPEKPKEHKPEQGTSEGGEDTKLAAADLDTLALRTAQYAQAMQWGYAKTAQLLDIFVKAGAAPIHLLTPEETATLTTAINEKMAAWKNEGLTEEQINERLTKIAQEDARRMKEAEIYHARVSVGGACGLVDFCLANGLLTQKQAMDIATAAGLIQPEPAIGKEIRQKVASCREAKMTDENIFSYIQKCALKDKTAFDMAPQGGPQPGDMQGALAQVIHELMGMVGQTKPDGQPFTEEDALNVLRQEGIPIDQMLGGAGGQPGGMPGGAPGGAPDGGMPGGAPGGMPDAGATPPPAGGASGGVPDGGMPPGGAPDAGAPPPDMGAGADAGAAGGPPAAVVAAPEGGKPEGHKPPGEHKSEGGDKKPEGGEHKSEGGDKKPEGEKKPEHKSEGGDKKPEGGGEKKEGKCDCGKTPCECKKGKTAAEMPPKAAECKCGKKPCVCKPVAKKADVGANIQPESASMPAGDGAAVAGDSIANSPEQPEAAGTGGDEIGALLQDIEAAGASGKLPPDAVASLKAILASAGGGEAPAGAGPGAVAGAEGTQPNPATSTQPPTA